MFKKKTFKIQKPSLILPLSLKNQKKDAALMITKPTLFIHGYAGNYFSFGAMMHRFARQGWGKKESTIIVFPSGEVIVKGKQSSLIQVLFWANRRNNVDDQVMWLWKITNILKYHYGISNIDLVSHSMGCVVALKYLNKFGYDQRVSQIDKVVTIGAPFNDIEVGRRTPYIEDHPLTAHGPIQMSPLYQWMKKQNIGLPLNIKFLNIAGNLQNGTYSDGQVSVNSALSLRYLVKDVTKQYHELIIKGRKAAHSLLHENQEVDSEIYHFLKDK